MSRMSSSKLESTCRDDATCTRAILFNAVFLGHLPHGKNIRIFYDLIIDSRDEDNNYIRFNHRRYYRFTKKGHQHYSRSSIEGVVAF